MSGKSLYKFLFSPTLGSERNQKNKKETAPDFPMRLKLYETMKKLSFSSTTQNIFDLMSYHFFDSSTGWSQILAGIKVAGIFC